jgi:hypothetical protein
VTRIALQDLLYFFPAGELREVVSRGQREYVLRIPSQFARPDWRRADMEAVLLERIPLDEREVQDRNILAWIGGGPERVADGDQRAVLDKPIPWIAAGVALPLIGFDRMPLPGCGECEPEPILGVSIIHGRWVCNIGIPEE